MGVHNYLKLGSNQQSFSAREGFAGLLLCLGIFKHNFHKECRKRC